MIQTDSNRVQIIPMIILDQFGTIMNLHRALISKTSNWSRTIFCRFLQQTGFTYLIAHLVRLGYSNSNIDTLRNKNPLPLS